MRPRRTCYQAVLIGCISSLAAGGLAAAEPENAPSKVEQIEGTSLSRVILTAQAAERLGIETTEVREMTVVRKRIVSGMVLEPIGTAISAATARTVSAPGAPAPAVLRIEVVPLGELDKTARNRPARVLPLTGAGESEGWWAEPAALADLDTVKDPDGPFVFEVHGDVPTWVGPGRVLVELALSDDATARKVVPYASVLYDIRGDTWIYTNPEPLVFVRQPVKLDYVDGNLAVLTDGPQPGTAVVSVGVAELFGTEFKIGK